MRKVEVIVLGAGVVGVATALYLRMSGRDVVLLDRGRPGDEASRGNAGIIERERLLPLATPLDAAALVRSAFNLSPEYRYSLKMLPRLYPWLKRLRAQSGRADALRFATVLGPLQEMAMREHLVLARRASAERFFRASGYLKLYRSEEGLKQAETELHYARIFGTSYHDLDRDGVAAIEPHLMPRFQKGIYLPDSRSVSSPGGVTKAYARYFREIGGSLESGDARTLRATQDGWSVQTSRGEIFARDVVVSLGIWSTQVLEPLGYRFPLIAARGYHQHFRPMTGATLSRPVLDVENGFILSPMEKGVRLTTGYEFANIDDPFDLSQLASSLRVAKRLFPLGDSLEKKVGMAARPCLPDGLPVVGHSLRHEGLWVNFGHGALGFTLAPATGMLLSQIMNGEEPFTDPASLSPLRFGV